MNQLHALHGACWMAALLAAGGAQAQYKVVAPDGSVTYTDRPPVASNVRVTPMNRGTATAAQAAATDIGLPLELRAVVQRNPVTLYTGPDCSPCDSGRRYLQQRGIPYSEKRVSSDEDASALERLVGGRTVPSLSIGPQPLRGFSDTDWAAYLDAAGYPRESRLPRNWQQPEPTTLVERAAPQPAARAPAPQPAAPQELPPASPGSIRF